MIVWCLENTTLYGYSITRCDILSYEEDGVGCMRRVLCFQQDPALFILVNGE